MNNVLAARSYPAMPRAIDCLDTLLAWVKQAMETMGFGIRPEIKANSFSRSVCVTTVGASNYATDASVCFNPSFDKDEIRAITARAYSSIFAMRLDAHSASRVAMLVDCQAGWDGVDAKPLDIASLQAATIFVIAHKLQDRSVGIFMSTEGEMILNWHGQDELLVELTFAEHEIAMYVDGMDDRVLFSAQDPAFEVEIARHI
ncbi:hypothetical protein ACTACN_04800 [Pseudomonas syringae]|uniref:hypothetical protein n=1 Tax=Pseudomonas syringae TaxID=317 RepID=UPI003F83B07B